MALQALASSKNKWIKGGLVAALFALIAFLIYRFMRKGTTGTIRWSGYKDKLSSLGRQFRQTIKGDSRGLRNNNPLNIRLSISPWKGKVSKDKNKDGAFEQFVDVFHGIRAAYITLRTYMNKHHLYTIQSIIQRWAPTSDGNHVAAYVASVAKHLGVSAHKPLNESHIPKLIRAMAIVELGGDYLSESDIQKGVALV